MPNLMIIHLLLIFCFLSSLPISCFNNETDLTPLLAFKSAIDLDPYGALNSWNQTTPFCTWTGIRCSRKHPDRVVTINLMSQGLVGLLSPHIGNLSFLRTIILQNNTFHGPIPTQISLLTRLEFIEFSNNSFSGTLPKNLSRCQNLLYLNLVDNKLSGNIPITLDSMPKLEALYIARNNLSGTIPPSIGNITSLIDISLLSCTLTGEIPESLTRLKNLEFLQLGDNGLTGTIPFGLFNISSIRYFDVAINQLNGVIPSTIGLTLPNLTELQLFDNQLNGSVPVSISNASFLEEVNFAENYFAGTIPRVGRLTNLRSFIFQSNLIADDINFISSLTNSTELENLEFGYNLLTGSLPESIANLSSQLTRLHLHTNKIHGYIPLGIRNLIGLTVVYLNENHLEGPIPACFAELSNLHEFDLSSNRLLDEIPSSLGNLTLLNSFFLNGNELSGNVPSSIGNCTSLIRLDLSDNNFDGLIPPEIMKLSSVSIELNLSYNALEGSIPYDVGSLRNVEALDLSNNRLSGVIPNSLSKCVSLQILHLEGNLLEGDIPSGLSALMGLEELDLSRNNLSGPIPSSMGKLNLVKLNLSFNRLRGEVPGIGVFKKKASISLDGNEGLCGGIRELKLPPCSSVKPRKKNLSTWLKILIPVLVAGGICFAFLVFCKYKKSMAPRDLAPVVSSSIGIQFMRLSFADLLRATGGFVETNLIGVGRFGSVYKGILDDGETLVAVKVLNLVVRGASKSFTAECNALRGVRHRNLVKILSICESIDFQGGDFKALVYEFKANGSLEKWLYNNKGQEEESDEEIKNLSMIQRLDIAIDIAQAIEYLHFGTDSAVIHGDLKPSNILLDHDMTACVGDFGLAKIVSDIAMSHESNSSIGIRGTIGYVPPEYGTNHSVSTQGDVYSFGIVLLEMFTNKRPTDDSFKDHVNLHGFVAAALPDRVMEIVDPQFQTGLVKENRNMMHCMTSILSIGVSCSNEVASDRLPMKNVVKELHNIRKTLGGSTIKSKPVISANDFV